jgi:hypothetical protein
MKCSAVAVALLLGAGCRPAPDAAPPESEIAAVFGGNRGRPVDLTHAFSEATGPHTWEPT